jgi:hypothetical protein
MGVYESENGKNYLAEKRLVPNPASPTQYHWQWFRYDDFTDPVSYPPYLPAKQRDYVTALSEGTRHYDYVDDSGVQRLGSWVNAAATQVGR